MSTDKAGLLFRSKLKKLLREAKPGLHYALEQTMPAEA